MPDLETRMDAATLWVDERASKSKWFLAELKALMLETKTCAFFDDGHDEEEKLRRLVFVGTGVKSDVEGIGKRAKDLVQKAIDWIDQRPGICVCRHCVMLVMLCSEVIGIDRCLKCLLHCPRHSSKELKEKPKAKPWMKWADYADSNRWDASEWNSASTWTSESSKHWASENWSRTVPDTTSAASDIPQVPPPMTPAALPKQCVPETPAGFGRHGGSAPITPAVPGLQMAEPEMPAFGPNGSKEPQTPAANNMRPPATPALAKSVAEPATPAQAAMGRRVPGATPALAKSVAEPATPAQTAMGRRVPDPRTPAPEPVTPAPVPKPYAADPATPFVDRRRAIPDPATPALPVERCKPPPPQTPATARRAPPQTPAALASTEAVQATARPSIFTYIIIYLRACAKNHCFTCFTLS